MKRVLLTGMSGTGKSTVIATLAACGYKAIDLDSDAYSHWVTATDALTPAPGKDGNGEKIKFRSCFLPKILVSCS